MTGTQVSVQVTATNITTTQFTVQIDSSNCEKLISIGAAWAAWDNDTKWKVGSLCGVEPQSGVGQLTTETGWMLQLATVGGVVFAMEQGVLVELVCWLSSNTGLWNCCSRQKHVKQYSANMIYVMKGH